MTSEEPLSSCLVLIHVVPPLIFTVMPFPATPTNYLAVPSPSLGVCHCNKRVMRKLFLHQYLQLAQLFTRGIVDIVFQSTAKMPHPQGRARLNIAKLLGCLPPWTVRWGMWIKYIWVGSWICVGSRGWSCVTEWWQFPIIFLVLSPSFQYLRLPSQSQIPSSPVLHPDRGSPLELYSLEYHVMYNFCTSTWVNLVKKYGNRY